MSPVYSTRCEAVVLMVREPEADTLANAFAAELAARTEAQELLASLGEVPCVEAGVVAEGGAIWVYPNDLLVADEYEDPYKCNHHCTTWVEALERIKTYVTLYGEGPT